MKTVETAAVNIISELIACALIGALLLFLFFISPRLKKTPCKPARLLFGGLLLLLLCAFPEIPRRSGVSRAASESYAAVLRVLLCAALVTALLLPWNISEFVGTGGFLSFWLDFIFFWMKALLAAASASFVSRRAGDVAFVRASALYAALIICGVVCMFVETGIF